MQAGSFQALPLSPRPSEARNNALLYSAALELRNGGQDVQLQPPCRRRGVDALPEGDERNPQRLEFVEQQNQVPEIPPQAVQPPADENIESPPTSGHEEFIKRGTTVLGTRHASVHVFDRGPAPALHIRATFRELVFHVLVERGDTRIEGAS